MDQQRWLSLEGICTVLQITHKHAVWLAQQGYLTVIWGDKSKKIKTARFLDPTPEYANKLRLGEAMYGRLHPLPKDLDMVAILTVREIAEILGWQIKYAQKYLNAKKVPSTKVGQYNLYSVAVVRDLLWRRDGRKLAKQKAPYLISDLIKFFMARYAAETEIIPTDLEFANDDILQRKLARIATMPSPAREEAMRNFYRTSELAKMVAQAQR